jgi:hypothetical protein
MAAVQPEAAAPAVRPALAEADIMPAPAPAAVAVPPEEALPERAPSTHRLAVTVLGTDTLRPQRKLHAPFVRVHVVPAAGVDVVLSGVPGNVVQPGDTQPQAVAGRRSLAVTWDQTVALDADFQRLSAPNAEATLVFELLDARPDSSSAAAADAAAAAASSWAHRGEQAMPRQVAWAFVKLRRGKTGPLHTDTKLRLQLYQPPADQRKRFRLPALRFSTNTNSSVGAAAAAVPAATVGGKKKKKKREKKQKKPKKRKN